MISDKRLLQNMADAEMLLLNGIDCWHTGMGQKFLESFKEKMREVLTEVDERMDKGK